jgi:hypothetical protein
MERTHSKLGGCDVTTQLGYVVLPYRSKRA